MIRQASSDRVRSVGTCLDVTEPRTKSFQLEADLLAAIKRWAKLYGLSDSKVIRVALVVGLKSLAKDPSPLEPEKINPDEISPPEGAKPPGETTIAMSKVDPPSGPVKHPDGSVTPPKMPWGIGNVPPPQEPKPKRKR